MSTPTNSNKSEWRDREVGALWKKQSQTNRSYCTGYLTIDELGQKTRRRVVMFANKEKKTENSPDFIIYLSNEKETDQPTTANTAAKTTTPAKPKRAARTAPQPPVEPDNTTTDSPNDSDGFGSDDDVPM